MSDMNELYPDQQKTTAGEILRKKRKERGLSLEDVSRRLRIRLSFLKALEEGKLDELPGLAYASGFLRTYADFLGVNANDILQRFRCEHQDLTHKQKLMFPAPVPQSGMPAAVIVLFGIIIIIGGYIAWYKITDHKIPPKEIIPSINTTLDPNGKNGKDNGQLSPQIASVLPTQKPNDSAKGANIGNAVQNVEKQVAAEQESARGSGQEAGQQGVEQGQGNAALTPQGAGNQQGKDHQPNNQPVAQPVAASGTETQENKASAGDAPTKVQGGNAEDGASDAAQNAQSQQVPQQALTLRILKTSWVRITDQDKHVLLEKILPANTDWVIPKDKPKLILTIGNARDVILVKDGKASKPLGKKGRVLRNFVLTPETAEPLLTEPLPPKASAETDLKTDQTDATDDGAIKKPNNKTSKKRKGTGKDKSVTSSSNEDQNISDTQSNIHKEDGDAKQQTPSEGRAAENAAESSIGNDAGNDTGNTTGNATGNGESNPEE